MASSDNDKEKEIFARIRENFETSHPSAANLRQYITNGEPLQLSIEECDRIDSHLRICQACAAAVDAITLDEQSETIREETGSETEIANKRRIWESIRAEIRAGKVAQKTISGDSSGRDNRPRKVERTTLHKYALVACVLLAITLSVWYTMRRDQDAFRSIERIGLERPAEAANVGVLDQFSWTAREPGQRYIFTVADPQSGKPILSKTVSQPTYVLLPEDAGKLENGKTYEWFVSVDGDSGVSRSENRHFRFVVSARGTGYQDFPADRRQDIEDRIDKAYRASDLKTLRVLADDLNRYISSKERSQSPDLAWALKTAGDAFYRLSDRGAALTRYRDSISAWERLGIPDAFNYGRSLVNYASTSQDIGEIRDAIQAYEKALTIFRSRDDKAYLEKRSTCLLNMGVLYREIGLA